MKITLTNAEMQQVVEDGLEKNDLLGYGGKAFKTVHKVVGVKFALHSGFEISLESAPETDD